jgi:hypothetical protein
MHFIVPSYFEGYFLVLYGLSFGILPDVIAWSMPYLYHGILFGFFGTLFLLDIRKRWIFVLIIVIYILQFLFIGLIAATIMGGWV